MNKIEEILQGIILPKMIKVRQTFPKQEVEDIEKRIQEEMGQDKIAARIRPGMSIAVGVGSRGVADIALVTRTVIAELKARGAQPFIVPAMGSHGGATAEGQVEILHQLGVTEEYAGCPIKSSMEVVEVGRLDNGMAVLMDRNAQNADGIVVINRVKAHTGFVGPNESGLMKMLTIGLGKQKGADACHARGWGEMAHMVVAMAKVKIQNSPVLFGVATYENADDRVADIKAIAAEDMFEAEQALLVKAKEARPSILFNPLDVLIVDELGKNHSGSGMDPYVTGRAATPYLTGLKPKVKSLAVLDVSEFSHGNCNGMGNADVTTRRLFEKINYEHSYANTLTSRTPVSSKIPLVMDSDLMAIKAAIQVSAVPDLSGLRMVRISSTSHLGEIYISEALAEEARLNPAVDILSDPCDMVFDAAGNFSDVGDWH